MSYPLIQQPAPLQQLAQTIQAIQQQRQLRQAQALQQMLGQAQLENAQNENALAPLRRSEMLARINQANVQTRGEEQTQAQRTRREALDAERLHQHAAASAVIGAALMNHPNEPTHPDVLAAFARAKQIATDPVVTDQIIAEFKRALEMPAAVASAADIPAQVAERQTQRQRADQFARQRPGEAGRIAAYGPQGAAGIQEALIRAAVAGAGGRGGITNTTALETVATIENADAAVREMENSFLQDPRSANPPTLTQAMAADFVRKHFGEQSATAVMNNPFLGLSSEQQDFQGAAQRFLHNASGLQAKGGRSLALLASLQHAYQAAAGQNDPVVQRRFIQAARNFVETYKAESARNPITRGGRPQAGPVANPAMPGGPFDDFLAGPPGGQP